MNLKAFAKPRYTMAAANLPSLRLEHASTEVTVRAGPAKRPCGFTVWVAGEFQVGWDWIEGDRNVIALFAPMSIFANAILLDSNGSPMSQDRTILALNVLVNGLPWQRAVASTVGKSPKRACARSAPALLAA